ncbi:MAG: helix-turn-helix domain-containing protein, partial [Peptococcaceae bacterium]|nr:helix-turn-helix domain-containing protein [Peptococcaceae bacterium]
MNQYVTGAVIKKRREEKNLTQLELAEILKVSDKAISKWETGKGYPDITLLEPLAKALDMSMIELLSGNDIVNQNRGFNMLRSKLYVCPICGNVLYATGEAVISCCGVTLPHLEAEEADEQHFLQIENVEDEYFISVDHEMTKEHYISFFAAVYDNEINI